jgi:hypothetical protein
MSEILDTILIIERIYADDKGQFKPSDYQKIQNYCDKIKQLKTDTHKHDLLLEDSLLVFYLEGVGLSPFSENFANEVWMWSRDKQFKNNILSSLEFLYYDCACLESKNFRSSILQVINHPKVAFKLFAVEMSVVAIRGAFAISMVGTVFVIVYFVWFCFETVFKFFGALFGIK